MNQKIFSILAVGFLAGPATIQAGVITQTFESSWSVDVRDYYGDVSAMAWQYQPYTPWDSSLGTLASVEILLEFTGTRVDPEDTVRIRSSLFTGWDPVQYQYSRTEYITGRELTFSGILSNSYTTPEPIAWVTDYRYFTGIYDSGVGSGGAWYYFESRSGNAAHTIDAQTTLSYYYDSISIPEPGTLGLLVIGMAGMRLARQRKTV